MPQRFAVCAGTSTFQTPPTEIGGVRLDPSCKTPITSRTGIPTRRRYKTIDFIAKTPNSADHHLDRLMRPLRRRARLGGPRTARDHMPGPAAAIADAVD